MISNAGGLNSQQRELANSLHSWKAEKYAVLILLISLKAVSLQGNSQVLDILALLNLMKLFTLPAV